MWNDFAMMPSPAEWGIVSTSGKDLTKDLVPIMGTDLIESDNSYSVHADLPGVDPKDLDVSITDRFLVLKAERKHVHEENTDKVHSMERSFGKVQRKIRLPNNADVDKAETVFKNGVLSITFPKKAAAPEGDVKKLHIDVQNA